MYILGSLSNTLHIRKAEIRKRAFIMYTICSDYLFVVLLFILTLIYHWGDSSPPSCSAPWITLIRVYLDVKYNNNIINTLELDNYLLTNTITTSSTPLTLN
uniref:Uncharacterized protein n=1 Tax=Cacopsylla melanoneura TaxID=428564 RepID=A0A8D8UVF4_9HEMI